MKKSKVYTKTGDSGETSILTGERVKKFDPRIAVYGDIDELNAYVGVVCSSLTDSKSENLKKIIAELQSIQSELFNIGAVVSCPQEKRESFKLKLVTEEKLTWLESRIDEYDSNLPVLKNFILPGGGLASSFVHVCRTVCRRAERECVHYNETLNGDIPELTIKYLNRLSDYFFILGRYVVLESGEKEILWKND